MDEEPSPFLQGLTFCIQRFSEVHEANIQNLIQEYSGTVTKSLDKCDNVIVPLIYKNEEKTSNPKEVSGSILLHITATPSKHVQIF